jgi:N-acetylneuraminic acid mutarotase
MKQFYLLSLFLLLIHSHALATGPWQLKPSIDGPGRHRGLGISIGNKGYVGTGHYNGAGPNIVFNDWWEFDPATNSWTQKANIPTPTYGSVGWGTSTKGYVGAGFITGGVYHVFDPVTNSWSNTSPCPISASNYDCFMVNGKGYVLNGAQMAEYDPSTDTWTPKTPCPSSLLTWSCAFETASSGFVKTGAYFHEYKPANDTWITRANFPGMTSSGATAFSIQGKGYVACGYVGGLGNVNAEFWEFNPATNAWTQMQDFPGTARRFHVSFTIGNKGFLGLGTNGTNFNDFWQFSYDPLSVDEVVLNTNTVQIYPNPVQDNIKIDFDPQIMEVVNGAALEIRTIDGRLVGVQEINKSTIFLDRGTTQAGMYVYSIVKNGKSIHQRKLVYQ